MPLLFCIFQTRNTQLAIGHSEVIIKLASYFILHAPVINHVRTDACDVFVKPILALAIVGTPVEIVPCGVAVAL